MACTDGVDRLMSTCFKPVCRGASVTSGVGLTATGCSSAPRMWFRRRSGAHQMSTFPSRTNYSATSQFILFSQSEILECTSTEPWTTSTTCCRPVSVLWRHQAVSVGTRMTTLVTTLVHSRLDYCNVVVFTGLPNCDIQRLQSVLNTAVRLVAGASRWDHVTRLLRNHHWFPIKKRSEYKLCMTSSKPARRCTNLYGRHHQVVCRSDHQSRLQIRHVWLSHVGPFVRCGCSANNLPSPLRQVHFVDTFRRQLKTF